MKETPYELLKDEQKKQLGKNNEAKMNLYNTLPRKEYEWVFMCKTAKEVWHTLIITHQGNSQVENGRISQGNSQVKNCKIVLLTQEYENKNHMRKFLRALPLKWRAKVMTIEEAKDLATLPLDELVRNLKVYEMILDNDDAVSKTITKENVKSLALKDEVTRDQTSDDSDSQDGSDEDIDEEEAEAFNLLARNFQVVSKPSSSNIDLNMIDLQKENGELLKFNMDLTKTFKKLFKEKCALKDKNSKLSSKINDLEIEVKKLVDKEVVEPS
ncbi:hypothetical protein Tco_0309658 [Tanacetum coccineum]